MTTLSLNEFGTASDTGTVGRFNLQGQQTPDYLVVLAGAVVEANKAAKLSAGEFDRRPSEATLQQLIEDERAAQDTEAVYLAELADWHDRQQWGRENAIEQVVEHF